jgi:exopolysaccharide biosynthesis polyprenyl glycosylphosphotransferase
MKSKAQFIMRLVRNFDLFVLAAVAALFWDHSAFQSPLSLLAVLLLIPIQASLLQYYGLYESHRIEGLGLVFRNLLSAHLVTLFLLGLPLIPFLGAPYGSFLLRFSGLTFALVFLSRFCLFAALRLLRRRGFDVRRVCIIGPDSQACLLSGRFESNPSWGMKLLYFGTPLADGKIFFRSSTREGQSWDSLESLLIQESVDEMLIVSRPEELEAHRSLMYLCKDHGVTARLLMRPTQEQVGVVEPLVEDFLGSTSFAVHAEQLDAAAMAGKRLMDILLSSVMILLLAPLLAAVAILVKLSSHGPVIFRQRRVGRGGRHFTMFKFRTMVDGAEGLLPSLAARNIAEGPAFKSKDDWRITPVGRSLRRYSLDELPQFLNVFLGDMSLVGPRPLPVYQAHGVERAFRRRFVMRPGLTCFWQVSGRSDITFASWMRMDLEYIDTWSLWLDAKLIFQTIPAVISGRGAY